MSRKILRWTASGNARPAGVDTGAAVVAATDRLLALDAKVVLDALVVARSPFVPGCVVRARPIGVLALFFSVDLSNANLGGAAVILLVGSVSFLGFGIMAAVLPLLALWLLAGSLPPRSARTRADACT